MGIVALQDSVPCFYRYVLVFDYFLHILEASFAMPIRILISASFLPSDGIVLPRYFLYLLDGFIVNVNVTCGGDFRFADDHTLRLFYVD